MELTMSHPRLGPSNSPLDFKLIEWENLQLGKGQSSPRSWTPAPSQLVDPQIQLPKTKVAPKNTTSDCESEPADPTAQPNPSHQTQSIKPDGEASSLVSDGASIQDFDGASSQDSDRASSQDFDGLTKPESQDINVKDLSTSLNDLAPQDVKILATSLRARLESVTLEQIKDLDLAWLGKKLVQHAWYKQLSTEDCVVLDEAYYDYQKWIHQIAAEHLLALNPVLKYLGLDPHVSLFISGSGQHVIQKASSTEPEVLIPRIQEEKEDFKQGGKKIQSKRLEPKEDFKQSEDNEEFYNSKYDLGRYHQFPTDFHAWPVVAN